MLALFVHLQSLLTVQKEKGATAVEYGLMVALIAAAIILTVTALGGSLNGIFTYVSDQIDAVVPAGTP